MKYTLTGKIYNKLKDELETVEVKLGQNGQLINFSEMQIWEPQPISEIGCYCVWGNDPRANMWVVQIVREENHNILQYRKQGENTWSETQSVNTKPTFSNSAYVQWFDLTNLDSDTRYEVRLKSSSNIYTFTTMPETMPSEIRIAGMSDITHHSLITAGLFEENMSKGAITEFDPHLILWAGDIVHDDALRIGDWVLFWDSWFKHGYRKNGDMIPIVPCLGNHDGAIREEDGTLIDLLWDAEPKDAPFFHSFFPFPGEQGYNVVDVGDYLSVIALDTQHTNPISGVQTDWLSQTLANRDDGRAIMPMLHVAPYPGYYGYWAPTNVDIRKHWTPLFTQYSVPFALTGHNHSFTVSPPITGDTLDENGCVYVGQGASFATGVRGGKSTAEEYIVAYNDDPVEARGFCGFVFTQDKATYKRFSVDGDVVYELERPR